MRSSLARAGAMSGRLASARVVAAERVPVLVRGVEDLLVSALAGEMLRGMADIAPPRRFYARRIFVERSSLLRWDKYSPVLTCWGRLLWAKLGDTHEVLTREPAPEDMTTEILEPYLEVVRESLDEHNARTDRRIQTYEATSELAEKMGSVLGIRFR